MKKQLNFGSTTISYDLDFAARKTLSIKVKPDRSVMVKAPVNSKLDRIENKLEKKAPWILKQQDFFRSFEPRIPKRRFVSGESHLYLGRQYRLKLITSEKQNVKLSGGFLKVFSGKNNAQKLMKNWYLDKAELWFFELAQPYLEVFERYGVKPNSIKLSSLKYRWGSCSAKNNIILNWELIKAPKACIEYVIVHELCHLVHPDHSQKFYKLQQKEFPEWQKWKNKLENTLA